MLFHKSTWFSTTVLSSVTRSVWMPLDLHQIPYCREKFVLNFPLITIVYTVTEQLCNSERRTTTGHCLQVVRVQLKACWGKVAYISSDYQNNCHNKRLLGTHFTTHLQSSSVMLHCSWPIARCFLISISNYLRAIVSAILYFLPQWRFHNAVLPEWVPLLPQLLKSTYDSWWNRYQMKKNNAKVCLSTQQAVTEEGHLQNFSFKIWWLCFMVLQVACHHSVISL